MDYQVILCRVVLTCFDKVSIIYSAAVKTCLSFLTVVEFFARSPVRVSGMDISRTLRRTLPDFARQWGQYHG